MQETFGRDPDLVSSFKKTLSTPRFLKYLEASENDDLKAIELYHWNSTAAQSLYVYLQTWEICLRNKLNDFFCWKYNVNWPHDDRAIRNFKAHDRKKLKETVDRQRYERGIQNPSTSMVVADLSAGFWVSQLNYDAAYGWKHNIKNIFPNDASFSSTEAWEICDKLLTLRNRVAHHEPIFNLPLNERHSDLRRSVSAMCKGSSAFAEATCQFNSVWDSRP